MESIHLQHFLDVNNCVLNRGSGRIYIVESHVEETTFEILDFSCTHTIATTQDFLRRLFLGQTFPEVDNWLEDALNRRYGGSSRKAVLVAYRDALKRWRLMTGNE